MWYLLPSYFKAKHKEIYFPLSEGQQKAVQDFGKTRSAFVEVNEHINWAPHPQNTYRQLQGQGMSIYSTSTDTSCDF